MTKYKYLTRFQFVVGLCEITVNIHCS